jgi:hypothetical protein
MTKILFQPLPSHLPPEAVTRYSAADISLTVGPKGEIPVGMHRLSIGSLTLSFTPDQHILVALDAYLNLQTCERRSLVVPQIDQAVAVICIEPFDEHGIAQAEPNTIQYIYAGHASLLLIQVGASQVISRIRCLSSVICGFGPQGNLCEIWLEGVTP